MKSLETVIKSYEQVEGSYQQNKKNVEKVADETRKMEEFLQTLSTGIAADEGKDNGYVDQIEGSLF